MDPELQAFAIEFTKKILPEVEGIVDTYKRDPEEGLSAYLDFIKRVKPSLGKIVKELRAPQTIGLISPRLLRDPLSIGLMAHRRSPEEEEAHIVGYLQAILQLVYCVAKGLEGWQFSGTPIHEASLKTQNVGKIHIIPTLVQLVQKEISEIPIPVVRKKRKSIKEKESIDENKVPIQKEPTLDDANTAVPFTARLIAYYRAQECKRDRPLIVDPFAERLAGDLTSYANKHKHICGTGDYAIVRAYYIENTLLTPWCHTQANSQIVLLGAGLDTRAFRFKPLQTNTHTLFEIDFSIVNRYKEEILQDEQPLCELVRLSTDLSNPDWTSHLIQSGFSRDIPTFWVLEGLIYYMDQDVVASLLAKAAEISTENSQLFADICVSILAELEWGPFTRYFKWGLEKNAVPSFFATVGWTVSCSFADDHDQGRDVGQKGLVFIHGVKRTSLAM